MDVTLQALMQGNAAAVAKAAVALFKSGQVLQALVIGQTGSGLTQLKVGDALIEAKLPQPAQPGTMLQLQVKTGGSAPQLVLMSQQPPPAGATAAPVPVPLPATVTPLPLPEVAIPAPATAPLPQQAPETAASAPQPQSAIAPQPQSVIAPPSQIESAAQPAAPLPTQPTAAPQAGAAQPPPTPTPVPQPATQPPAPPNARPVVPGPAIAGDPAIPPAATAPLPPQAAPPPAAKADVPPTPVQPQLVAAEPETPVPAPVASTPSATAAPPPDKPAAAPHQQVQSTAATPPPATPDEPEATAASPLLVAQAAPRPPQTMADLPKAAPVPPQQPAGTPAAAPATPEQALTQMVPEAMAKQNSVAPLLQSLAALIAKPAILPEPIMRAALAVLAQRIVTPDGKVAARDIAQAVARSGVFLEASLAAEAPVRGDAKAALLNLRTMLEKFLGETPAAPTGAGRAAPPVNGQPPRALPVDLPALPDAPRDVARALHGEADAAISRVKLGQLAALPDAPNAPSSRQPELRLDLPFLIGHELVMAQLQISRDGKRSATERKRGWTMRFAMNFSASGEVGAEIGLLGKAVNVHLWAAEPETADALNAALPELASALTAIGLDPGAVRIRNGVPEPARIASGHFVDSVS